MKISKNILIAFAVFTLSATGSLPNTVRAEGRPDVAAGPRSYVFHLAYNAGKLSINSSFITPYEILIQPFVPATTPQSSSRLFKGEIRDAKKVLEYAFSFDPAKNTDVHAPYYPDAFEARFYDPSGALALSIPLDATSLCNDNGRCDADYDEDNANCPADCTYIPTPAATVAVSAFPGTTPETGGSLGLWIIFISIGILIAAFFVIIIRKRI